MSENPFYVVSRGTYLFIGTEERKIEQGSVPGKIFVSSGSLLKKSSPPHNSPLK
jgi:hypothetical protein